MTDEKFSSAEEETAELFEDVVETEDSDETEGDDWDEFGEFEKELGDDLDSCPSVDYDEATFDGLADFDLLSGYTEEDVLNDAVQSLRDLEGSLPDYDVDKDMSDLKAKRDAKAAPKAENQGRNTEPQTRTPGPASGKPVAPQTRTKPVSPQKPNDKPTLKEALGMFKPK